MVRLRDISYFTILPCDRVNDCHLLIFIRSDQRYHSQCWQVGWFTISWSLSQLTILLSVSQSTILLSVSQLTISSSVSQSTMSYRLRRDLVEFGIERGAMRGEGEEKVYHEMRCDGCWWDGWSWDGWSWDDLDDLFHFFRWMNCRLLNWSVELEKRMRWERDGWFNYLTSYHVICLTIYHVI